MFETDFVGFGLAGFRSFGEPDIKLIGPMAKIHLVVGRNNVGKSNILHLAHETLNTFRLGPTSENGFFPGSLDKPRGAEDLRQVVSIGVSWTFIERQIPLRDAENLRPLLTSPAYSKGTDGIWFDFYLHDRQNFAPDAKQLNLGLISPNGTFSDQIFSQVSSSLTSTAGNSAHNLRNVVSAIAPWSAIPAMRWVDTHRQVTADAGNAGMGIRTGQGLVDALAALQNPSFETHDADTEKWALLVDFVRGVLDDQSANIQIPNGRDTILVATSSTKAMPLSSLGTGIGQLILLAAVATTVSNELICIEEPELHLHPTLQRMLVQYLNDGTKNRYLISTHSASMLNAELASISHVSKTGQWSDVVSVATSGGLALAVSDLGNRPSDLVQSNYVVWVEGPSDRIYLAHWITLADSELIEGVHYTVMFYGGALLSHLSADDNETDELIDLLRINRSLAMVIDSDRSQQGAPLNATKTRVIAEMERIGGHAWVTSGYTIENEIDLTLIEQSVSSLYPNEQYELPSGKFESPLGHTFVGKRTKPSKVSVARKLTSSPNSLTSLSQDASSNISRLVHDIRSANGLPTSES